MVGYQRFLSYLFAYEGDEKKQNCGFVRAEVRGEVQRILVSVQSQEPVELLHVSGFYRKDGGCKTVLLGQMIIKGGKGQLQYYNSGPYLAGSKIRFQELAGIVIGRQHSSEAVYATVWDEEPFGLSMLREPSVAITCLTEGQQSAPAEKQENCGEDASAADTAVWEILSASYPHIETLPGDEIVCLKAAPADIGRLPRQNWMLSNNGFLMYSYVKHRYIVFAKIQEGRYELWVPGNYDRNEEMMAQMFGFYRFHCVKARKAQKGDFGYWCVPLAFPSELSQA